MRDKVLRLIRREELLAEGDRVLVALSGGADSVSLLHALVSIKELYRLQVNALHFNHMIRGDEAERDERFCRELCERLGVTCYFVRENVPFIAQSCGESVELCGRRLRYEALGQFADVLGGAKIATAHHRGDNTETVLLNLVRGTGIGGLCGIPVRRGDVIRPLLDCTRDEIEAYCRSNALDYVTDSTNLSDAYTRNHLRLHILPHLRELNPSLDEGVQRTAAVMRDADAYLNKISFEELNKCQNTYGYDCAALLRLDRIILSYAVKQIVEAAGASADHCHIGLVIDAMRSGGAVDLGQGCRAECAQGVLRVIDLKAAAEDDLCIPIGEYPIERCSMERARATTVDKSGKINKKFLNNLIPCDIITDDTVVRHRRAGDTFTDPRRGVTKTLKKLMNELKIPREKRGGVLLIADGSTVLWLEGVGTSEQARLPDDYVGDVYVMRNG